MAKTWSHETSDAELEALIRSAGDFVQVSPGFRPRVLGAARAEHLRQVRRRWATCAVAAVVLLAALSPRTFTTQSVDEVAARQLTEHHDTVVPESLLASSPTSWIVVSSGNDWEMVENFCRLRQYHLHVLQQAF